jgi:hypothetical protein
MSWKNLVEGDDAMFEEWQALEVQLLFEVLLVLAFGRTIVVPQPYAFDSLPFLSIARTTLRARDSVARGERMDRPFRLSVFYQHGFDAALGEFIGRINHDERPFASSLFPELHELTRPQIEAIASDLHLLPNHVVADDDWGINRLDGVALIRREFGGLDAPTVRGTDNGVRPLNRILRHLRSIHVPMDATAPERDSYDLLQRGVAAWLDRVPDANHRSWLRSRVWPGTQLTPAEVVGGADVLDALIEFTDTAYNGLLARSASVGVGSFTTSMVTSEAPERERRLSDAQRVSLKVFTSTFADALLGHNETTSATQDQFGLALRPGAVRAERKVALQDVRDELVGALHAVMEARAQDLSSPFWTSARSVNEKLRDNANPTSTKAAIDSHINTYIRKALTGKVEVSQGPGLTLLLSISSDAAAAFISSNLSPVEAVASNVGLAIGAQAWLLSGLISAYGSAWQQRKRWRRVLSEAVTFVEHDG